MALTEDDLSDILLACSDVRLKTYVMFSAFTGMRAVETLSIILKDINLDSNPARITLEENSQRQDRIDMYM